jgi:hypothetical protein
LRLIVSIHANAREDGIDFALKGDFYRLKDRDLAPYQ